MKQSGECSCAEARAQLEAFLDHECEKDVEARLRVHVASCEHCSRVADAERHMRALMRSKCVEQAPAQLRERVRAQLSLMCGGATFGGTVRAQSVEHVERVESSAGGVRVSVTRTVRYEEGPLA